MAEKLSIQIALEGGAEIVRQLAGIGEAGQKAFADIVKMAEQVGGFKNLKPEQVTAKLQEMGVTGVEAIDKIQAAVQKAGRLETLVKGIAAAETGLKALAIAAVPIGIAVVAGMVAATKATIAFAESINKVNEQAIGLGLSIEKFDQMRQRLEGLGISAKGVTGIMEGLGQAADTAALSKVTQAIKELQEASTRGFGAQGTEQLKVLEEAAKGVGPAADTARKALVAMGLVKVDPQGVPIIEGLPKTLAQLVGSTGSAEAGLKAFVAQLAQMPNKLDAGKLAVDQLKQGGAELAAALQQGGPAIDAWFAKWSKPIVGGITPEMAANARALTAAINELEAAWNRFGSVTFAPFITAQIKTITQALQALQDTIDNLSFRKFMNAAEAAGSALGWLTPAGLVAKALGAAFGEATPAVQQTGQAMQRTGQAAAQAGQQAAQAGQQAAQGLSAWDQVVRSLELQGRTTGQTFQQAGQQAAQAGEQTAQAGQQAAQGLSAWDQVVRSLELQGRTTGQTFQQTGQQAAQAGEQTAQAGQQATSGWGTVKAAVDTAIDAVGRFFEALGRITWEAISNVGVAAWNALSGAIQTAIDRLLQFMGLKPSAPSTGGGAPGKARGGLLGGRGTGTSDSNLAWLSRGEYIMPARAVAQPGVLSFLEALRRSGSLPRFASGGLIPSYQGGGKVNVKGSLEAFFGAVEKAVSALGGMAGSAENILNTTSRDIMKAVSDLIKVHDNFTTPMKQLYDDLVFQMRYLAVIAGKTAQETQGKARGGLLGGRGTGTSDSNLAWVSRGEHIMPARAVSQPGVLAFLELLRRSGGNLRAVLDGMGRFALGGMVPRAIGIPAYAAGGLAGGSNVTIQFPGLPAIGGLRASSDVVDQLHKAAALAQVRSGGRKPSRYS